MRDKELLFSGFSGPVFEAFAKVIVKETCRSCVYAIGKKLTFLSAKGENLGVLFSLSKPR